MPCRRYRIKRSQRSTESVSDGISKRDRSKVDAYKSYHKVDAYQMRMGKVDMLACVQELNERVVFTKRYYGGRYDKGHKRWMRNLYSNVESKIDYKVGLSLDALVVMNRKNR